jgi:UPF0755 protein
MTIKNITLDKKMIAFNTIEFFLILTIIFSFYFTLLVDSKRVIFIPKGSTNYIITYLDKKNYDLINIDKALVKYFGYPQSGWIDLKKTKMTKMDFLYRLTKSKAALVNVTLIPGETYYFFLKSLSAKMKIDEVLLFNTYKKYAYKKDGNIISQTYSLPIGMNANDTIKYLTNYTNNQYKKYSNKIFGAYNKKKWYKYIALASVIQKESASKDEMPTIASVIYNRLEKNMKLQMDGTLDYGKYSHKKVTPKMVRSDLSDYNTYKVKGIPSHPVCAVEFESIKAAIFPATTEYLYFMKSINGKKHLFSKTYRGHKQYIKKIQKYKKSVLKKKVKKKVYKKIKSKPKKIRKKQIKDIWKNVK